MPHSWLQASFAKQMGTALFWAITNFLTDVSGQHVGPIFMGKESKKILHSMVQDSWPLRMGPIGSPETSVRNYHYMLRNSPEDRSSQNESWIARRAQMQSKYLENTKLVTQTFFLKENRTYIHTTFRLEVYEIIKLFNYWMLTNAHRCNSELVSHIFRWKPKLYSLRP